MHKTKWLFSGLLLLALFALAPTQATQACGGFFCTNVPVDQAAERIIFAVNDGDGTIDAYVQINYQGAPDAFAWVVPVPNPPKLDVATLAMMRELDRLTQPVYIAPSVTDACSDALRRLPVPAAAQPPPGGAAKDGVTVFDQGEVGPFNYAVVGSEEPKALVKWLRDN